MKKTTTALLFVTGALTLLICGVMNLYLIPLIEQTTEGIRMFDMQSFGYTAATAREFLRLLSDEGRDTFLHKQLPLDFFYPVAYGAFFMLSLAALSPRKKALRLLPAALMFCDYGENIFSLIMLRTDFSDTIAHTGCAFTVTKTALMTVVIVLLLVLLIKKFAQRKKNV